MKKAHIGSNFEVFLAQEMKRRRISRTAFAGRMKTPRASIDRLFADNASAVSLQLLERAPSPWAANSRLNPPDRASDETARQQTRHWCDEEIAGRSFQAPLAAAHQDE